MLRKNDIGSSMGSLKKLDNRRDSINGSTNSLKKDYLQVPNAYLNTGRRNSRRLSNDSLDGKRNSWDPSRRGSSGSSCGWDEPIWEEINVKVIKTKQYLQMIYVTFRYIF